MLLLLLLLFGWCGYGVPERLFMNSIACCSVMGSIVSMMSMLPMA